MVISRSLNVDVVNGSGGRWHPGLGRLLVVERGGRLVAIDPATGALDVLGAGFERPRDVELSADGASLLVSEQAGTILVMGLDTPSRDAAAIVATGLVSPHSLAMHPDSARVLCIEHAQPGRLVAVALADGIVTTIAEGFDRAIGLVIDPIGNTAFLTEQGTGRLLAVDLATGTVDVLMDSLRWPGMLSWADDDGPVLLVIETSRVLQKADRSFPTIPKAVDLQKLSIAWQSTLCVIDVKARALTRLGTVPAGAAMAVQVADAVFLTCRSEVAAIDASRGLRPRARLTMPARAMYVGGWARVPVEVRGLALTFNDLAFEVPEGPKTGAVSPSRDATFREDAPDVMLLGGAIPGTYGLVARHGETGDVLGEGRFTIDAAWPDANGPPVVIQGVTGEIGLRPLNWGGGPPGPQNIGPALEGTRRIAIVLCDTSDQRWDPATTEIADAQARWPAAIGGGPGSADAYFREVSNGLYGLAAVGARAFGPYALDRTWDQVLEPMVGFPVPGSFKPTQDFYDHLIARVQFELDLDVIDTILIVMRSAPPVVTAPGTPPNPPRAVWPWASLGGQSITYISRAGRLVQKYMGAVFMPSDQIGTGVSTLAHELMHNLGLEDAYMNDDVAFPSADMRARDVTRWDVMSSDDDLPRLTLASSLRLGWVPPSAVKTFDFAAGGGAAETIRLQATGRLEARGAPPAGNWAGAEIRRAHGWNYYFEYRAETIGSVSDTFLPERSAVLGTDVVSSPYQAPEVRRSVVLLANDGDDDGPVLVFLKQDYMEREAGSPDALRVELIDRTSEYADVAVSFGPGQVPDPFMRPWPGKGDWRSPDIQIRNGLTDDGITNLPWTGHLNRIVATIHNGGPVEAPDVRVEVYVKDMTVNATVGPGGLTFGTDPPVLLGQRTVTVPASGSREIEVEWVPVAGSGAVGALSFAHNCIEVRILPYQHPTIPFLMEASPYNNIAQSNYTVYISTSASPSKRGLAEIVISNPHDTPALAWVVAEQTHPFYRTYLQHKWVRLGARETRRIGVMTESPVGDPALEKALENDVSALHESFYSTPNRVSLTGLVENPHDHPCCLAQIVGGANIMVFSARRMVIELDRLDEIAAAGRVMLVDTGEPATQGAVIVSIQPDGDGSREVCRRGEVDGDGRFFFRYDLSPASHEEDGRKVADARRLRLQAHYAGSVPFAPADSKVVEVER